ncbi:MAG: hypothetical protein AB7G11_02510 [Phycisphaerales bacterium]
MSRPHTPEPWYIGEKEDGDAEQVSPGHWVGGYNGCMVFDPECPIWAPPSPEEDGPDAEIYPIGARIDEADARRIVACVNACKGIPTGELENGAILDLLASARNVLAWANRANVVVEPEDEQAIRDLRETLDRVWPERNQGGGS